MSDFASQLASYLGPIIPLCARFAAGEIDGETFESEFFPLYRQLPIAPTEDLYLLGERLFFAVEDHVFDEQLRDPGDLSTEELKRRAVALLRDAGQLVPSATQRRDPAAP